MTFTNNTQRFREASFTKTLTTLQPWFSNMEVVGIVIINASVTRVCKQNGPLTKNIDLGVEKHQTKC